MRSAPLLAVAALVACLGAATSITRAASQDSGGSQQFLGDGKAKVVNAAAVAAAAPNGFTDTAVINGLTNPTNIRFASDGRIFVAEKSGILKEFDSVSDTTPTIVADLSSQVDNYWDRGMLGMALDPNFPASPYIYLLFAYDGQIGATAPVWNDGCPTPPGPTTDGCVISSRLVRIQLSGSVMTGSPKVLIQDQWCQQYPSHSVGDLVFGPDGALYVSGGDGASFTFADYGQGGGASSTPANPCGDPPSGSGHALSPPTAEGGALRAQSFRRGSGEPVLLNGAILRLDPATGNGLADNPSGSSSDANARRIIAYGFRNPFRFTFRPGTSELWMGDVGWNDWEEINRFTTTSAGAKNFGWPCYEGNSAQSGYQSAGLSLCSSLYSAGSALPPYFTYQHGVPIAGESCPTANGSVISALSFYTSGSYPSSYNGALFFGDHSRNCIWVMPVGSNGLPDPTKVTPFITGAVNPVDIESGPNGDLFYVDFDGGTIHRITYGSGQQQSDLALNKTATSSSTDDATHPASAGNDGNSGTRWSSAWSDNQWWQVDLGSAQSISSVSLNWETAYASTYKIQVSNDGTNFTDAATVTNSAPGVKTTTFTPVTARYVRVLGVTRATQWGISFWDASVFGSGDAGGPVNTSPPTVSGTATQSAVLTATNGTWSGSPTSYAYQWQRCDATGANCSSINGAGAPTYTVAAGDAGQTLRVGVTATNAAGASLPAYSAVTAVVGGGSGTDLALGKPATSSSNDDNTLHTPAMANDGNSATRWSSDYIDNQWWQVDLGSAQTVSSVSLNWETAYASSYKIQVSTDGTTFTDVATVTNTAAGVKATTFTSISARYVRVLGITRATQWGISFWDAQVFGPSSGAGAPTPVIDTPSPTLTYQVGDPVSFSGHATDPQQGTLPGSALTWTLIIHHCTTPDTCHIHLVQNFTGLTGSFNAPDHGYPSWLELQLVATDSGGLTGTTSIRLNPQTADLTFATVPAGLSLAVNSGSTAAPFVNTVIIKSLNSVSAPTTQTLNGTTYQFVSWSDGGAATHNITAPATATTYTATYQAQAGGSGDLALGKTATASSSDDASRGPGNANDGNSATRWSSGYTDNQWWQVDLGSAQTVSSVTLNWEAAYASTYKIQTSTNGTTFTDAATVTNTGAGVKTTTFTAVSARYVRVLGVTRATQWGISLWDASVFGSGTGGGGGGSVPVNTASPTISGSATQGSVLTAANGTWSGSPTSFAYQWQRCDTTGANCSSIGATAQTYTVAAADVGKTIRVAVTASNATGPSAAATSAATAVVTGTGGGGGSCPAGQYEAQYFSGITLSGTPLLDRCEAAPINYSWGSAAPAPGVPADQFSVRWSGSFTFTAGNHTFKAVGDDGVRVYVDGVLQINGWKNQSATTYQAKFKLTAGVHTVTFEYYDNTGTAVAQLSWT